MKIDPENNQSSSQKTEKSLVQLIFVFCTFELGLCWWIYLDHGRRAGQSGPTVLAFTRPRDIRRSNDVFLAPKTIFSSSFKTLRVTGTKNNFDSRAVSERKKEKLLRISLFLGQIYIFSLMREDIEYKLLGTKKRRLYGLRELSGERMERDSSLMII